MVVLPKGESGKIIALYDGAFGIVRNGEIDLVADSVRGAKGATAYNSPNSCRGGARTFLNEGFPLLWLWPLYYNSSATNGNRKTLVEVILPPEAKGIMFTNEDSNVHS